MTILDIGYDDPRDIASQSAPVPQPRVRVSEADDTHGVFIIEPVPRGYGVTIGNPLRRVLLNSVPGAAIDWVRIKGVHHEYSSIPHVKEDVMEILLNIKAINIRAEADRPGKLRLDIEGSKGEITASDIMASSDFEIVNPELHIATLDSDKASLDIEMNVEQGRGYYPASSHEGLPIGVLPVDAIFTPVRKVNYTVEPVRIGQQTDFERLIIEVWTNGAKTPGEAVRAAAQELEGYFFLFTTVADTPGEGVERSPWALTLAPAQYNMQVESLGLSARTLNCLKRASIHKVGEVVDRSRAELLRIRNFGERSLEELDEKLTLIGISHPDLRGDKPALAEANPTDEEEGEE